MPLQVITVSIKDQTVAAIDLVIDTATPNGKELSNKLLTGYKKVCSHKTTMLTVSLDEDTQTFEELERPSARSRALTLNNSNGSKIIFFAADLLSLDQVMPSVDQLPLGLLEKARALAKKQKDMIEEETK